MFFMFSQSNARRQPPAARNHWIDHDALIEGAPTVGCKPQSCTNTTNTNMTFRQEMLTLVTPVSHAHALQTWQPRSRVPRRELMKSDT